MSRFRETGTQTDPEEDDVFDISPTSTLQRGSLTSPTSSGHQHGIFTRLRNSFSSQKIKELKRQLHQYEEDITTLTNQLQSYSQENSGVQLRLTDLVKSNPFNVYITGACRNVQVGGSNTMVHNPSTETLVADLEELTGKLTSAVQENTQERTNAELKLRNSEVLLKEMTNSLEICRQALDKLDRNTSSKLGQVKQLIESLTSDRSDSFVITEGIERLKQYVVDRKRMVRSADGLPWDVQNAIIRLVNKLGHLSWQEFARMLSVSESSIQARGTIEKGEDADRVALLDRDMCTRILVQWINQSSDNDADKLLHIVQDYEIRASKEMTETFRKKTVSQSLIPTVVLPYEQSQRSSMADSDTSAGSGSGSWNMRRAPSQQLPDHRSQFEHQLLAWNLQVEMNAKLDTLLSWMTEQSTSKKNSIKMKNEDVLHTKLMEEGHFV